MDWIFPERDEPDPFKPPMPGSMAKPVLGVMMLCFVFMGLACFDGFMGFSYLAVFFVSDVMPSDLYKEAFDELHERAGLPHIDENATFDFSFGMTAISGAGLSGQWNARRITSGKGGVSSTSNVSGKSAASKGSRSVASGRSDESSGKESASSAGSIDEEIAALLGTTSRRLDIGELDNES
jgi:hypothetical protein